MSTDLPERPLGPAGEAWYVLDSANVLSDSTEATLQEQLSTLVQDTSSAMVVVTIPTLDDYPIEMYSLELGREWEVGQDEYDNGLVFLVVPDDHLARIEVGYGLEGAVTDSTASRILNTVAIPYFKDGDYDQGVLQSVTLLESLVRGEEFDMSLIEQDNPIPEDIIFSVLIYGFPLLWALCSWFSSTKAWWIGGFFGGVFGFVFGSWTGLAIGGIGGLLLDFVLSKYLFQKIRGPGGAGFWSGGGGGGRSGGDMSGFGGGGFGGGGASGRW